MENNENIIKELNNLVQINNDRIEGYEKASKETDANDLKDLFGQMATKSRTLKSQLGNEILKRGGKPTESTTNSGKFFRVWMDFKSALTSKNRKAILSSCEFGEDAAQETYSSALNSNENLPSEITSLINSQKSQLKDDHNKVKSLRDSTVNV